MLSTGRTTFVNTLCGKPVLEHKESDDPSTAHVEEGVKIEPVTVGKSIARTRPQLRRALPADASQNSMRRARASH